MLGHAGHLLKGSKVQRLNDNAHREHETQREGETPAKISMEEYRLQQESQGGRTNDATVECLKYLTGKVIDIK